MIMPLKAIDALLSVFALAANSGSAVFGGDGGFADLDVVCRVVDRIRRLTAHLHPLSLAANPIVAFDVMSAHDGPAYCPLAFGYVNYATPGFRPMALRFGDIPAGSAGRVGGTLGGAGIGVSAHTTRADEAARFAAFVCSDRIQGGAYVAEGGQPGNATAWDDPRIDETVGHFFSGTLSGIRSAYLRPRWSGYLPAQTAASELLHLWLTAPERPVEALVRDLSRGFIDAFERSNARTQEGQLS
jgi:multiple sugar transport system substrate-binding protein